jgi:hypothetical protein
LFYIRILFKKIIPVLALLFVISFLEPGCYAQRLEGVQKYDTTLMAIHSPKKTAFYSAVLPGLGQIYNKKYWKVPICYAALGTFVYFIDFNQTRYVRYKRALVLRLANDPNNPDEFLEQFNEKGIYTEAQLQSFKDFYRRNRDLSIMGLAGIYVLNIIDATVDGYLFDYDISPDLTMHITPNMDYSYNSSNFGVLCTFRF